MLMIAFYLINLNKPLGILYSYRFSTFIKSFFRNVNPLNNGSIKIYFATIVIIKCTQLPYSIVPLINKIFPYVCLIYKRKNYQA